jgi:hypothetical protein
MVKNKTTKKYKFRKKDFNSNDGMLTTVWGPPMWHTLHTISFNYPVNPSTTDKTHYKEYILSLKNILPCGKCRTNLGKNMKSLPLKMTHMKSRETFSKYIYDLHELVNKMLGKVSGLSFNNIKNRYELFRSRCKQTIRTKNTRKENGCTEPLIGEKSKCILSIVPKSKKCETFQIDKHCEILKPQN